MPHKIEYAHFSVRPTFNKRTVPVNIPEKNQELLLTGYQDYEESILQKYKTEYREFQLRKLAFDKKVCQYCKGKLRLVPGYGFWGCENYRDGGKHSTFSNDQEFYYQPRVRVNAHWVTEIIKSVGLKNHLTAKMALAFFESQNLEDLRLKYDYERATGDIINTFILANNRSKIQEKEAHEFLKKEFPKVVPQQCIVYKLEGLPETFCIPDFICGTPSIVQIVDAKLDYVDDEKMQLYIDLVKFIIEKTGDTRKVEGAHIMYEEEANRSKSKFKIFKLI